MIDGIATMGLQVLRVLGIGGLVVLACLVLYLLKVTGSQFTGSPKLDNEKLWISPGTSPRRFATRGKPAVRVALRHC
jgi:hypothetical protein